MRLSFFAAALLSASFAAHADTLILEQIQGAFQSGATLTGTVTLDDTSHRITAANLLELNAPDGGGSINYSVFNKSYYQSPYVGKFNMLYAFDSPQTPSYQIALLFTSSSYENYTTTGSVLCTVSDNPCGFASETLQTRDGLEYATVTPVLTPEPSSIALLSTGVLGIACIMRRRLV